MGKIADFLNTTKELLLPSKPQRNLITNLIFKENNAKSRQKKQQAAQAKAASVSRNLGDDDMAYRKYAQESINKYNSYLKESKKAGPLNNIEKNRIWNLKNDALAAKGELVNRQKRKAATASQFKKAVADKNANVINRTAILYQSRIRNMDPAQKYSISAERKENLSNAEKILYGNPKNKDARINYRKTYIKNAAWNLALSRSQKATINPVKKPAQPLIKNTQNSAKKSVQPPIGSPSIKTCGTVCTIFPTNTDKSSLVNPFSCISIYS